MFDRTFPWAKYDVTEQDREIAHRYIGSLHHPADLVIAPDGEPYIYRWHLVRGSEAAIYFHIQVADDPERPLHDHPWDNMSAILAGGYRETVEYDPRPGCSDDPMVFIRKPGAVVFRRAESAHRLELLPGVRYTMSQFACGPKRRSWGFWFKDGWRSFEEVTTVVDGKSVHTPIFKEHV